MTPERQAKQRVLIPCVHAVLPFTWKVCRLSRLAKRLGQSKLKAGA
jgi:hypothetical protein